MELVSVGEKEDSYKRWLSSLKPDDEAFEQAYKRDGCWVYTKVIIQDVDTYTYPSNSGKPFNPETGYCTYFNSSNIFANPLPYKLVPVSSVLTNKNITVGQTVASTDDPVYWELWKHKTVYRVLKRNKPALRLAQLKNLYLTEGIEAYSYVETIIGSDYDLLYTFCEKVRADIPELELMYTTTFY
jgi:hypothetical protein